MTALLLIVSIAGALVAGISVRSRPVLAFGVLFALAAFSRLTVELPPGTMRLEQPAIAAVGLGLAVSGRIRVPSGYERRLVAPIVAGLVVYLACLTLASAFVAPDRIESLRIAAWHALSISGGVAAFLLLRGRAAAVTPWLVGIGLVAAAIGVIVGLLFLVVGNGWTLGIQGTTEGFPRVYAIAWEGNLYASFLGALVPFAFERFRAGPSVLRAAGLFLIAIGFALALTRGAYLGLGVGLAAQFGALIWHGIPWRRLVTPGVVLTACLLCAVPWPNLLLPSRAPVPPTVDATPAPIAPGRSGGEATAVGAASPPPSSGTTPSAAPTPIPSDRAYPDTIRFRLDRIQPALNDLSTSPIIGLGADSFGQRHADPSQGGAPDHLGFLVLAVPYDSGLVGAAGFWVAIAAILWLLLRSLRGPGATPLAAAYLGSIVSLLVAYQATNAIHFAINWLLLGAATALAADSLQAAQTLDVSSGT